MNSAQNPTYDAALAAKFASAARHSRLVRILRVAVPGAVLLSLAAIVGVSIFNPFRMLLPKLPLDSGNLVVSGTKITMESPHLAGYTAGPAAVRALGQDRDAGHHRPRPCRSLGPSRKGPDGRSIDPVP
ncbi:hypothetical protein ACVIYH_006278 [Bradyrhizobium diazoefficiens]